MGCLGLIFDIQKFKALYKVQEIGENKGEVNEIQVTYESKNGEDRMFAGFPSYIILEEFDLWVANKILMNLCRL